MYKRLTTIPMSSEVLKFKKLFQNAKIPEYSKKGDAGLNLFVHRIIDDGLLQITYGTGIAIEIPVGYVGLIFPRSSVRNYSLILANCVGVIDSGYRGEIEFTFKKVTHPELEDKLLPIYEVGDKCGQLILFLYPELVLEEVDELSESERGNAGFGSTGK